MSFLPPIWWLQHKAFCKVGSEAGPEIRQARHSHKCLRHCWYYPKKVYLRRLAINLALLKRVRAWLDGSRSMSVSTAWLGYNCLPSLSLDRETVARDETHRPDPRRFATTSLSASQLLVELMITTKLFLFQAILFSQTVIIQPIQFSISIDFVYTVKCQNSSIIKNSL